MDEYTIIITGSLRGAAVQVSDSTTMKILGEANDLTDQEALDWVGTWMRENVL